MQGHCRALKPRTEGLHASGVDNETNPDGESIIGCRVYIKEGSTALSKQVRTNESSLAVMPSDKNSAESKQSVSAKAHKSASMCQSSWGL